MDLLDLTIDLNSVEPSSSTSSVPQAQNNKKRSVVRQRSATTIPTTPKPMVSESDAIGSGKRQRIKNTRRFSPSPDVPKRSRLSIVTAPVKPKSAKLSELGDILRNLRKTTKPTDFVLPKWKNVSHNPKRIEEICRKIKNAGKNKKETDKSKNSSKSPTRASQRKPTPSTKFADLPSQSAPSQIYSDNEDTEKKSDNIQEDAMGKERSVQNRRDRRSRVIENDNSEDIEKNGMSPSKKTKESEIKKPNSRSRRGAVVTEEVEEKNEENLSEEPVEQHKDKKEGKGTDERSPRKSLVLEKTENVVNGESTKDNRKSKRKSANFEKVATKNDEVEKEPEQETEDEEVGIANEEQGAAEVPQQKVQRPRRKSTIKSSEPTIERKETTEESEKVEVPEVAQQKVQRPRRKSTIKPVESTIDTKKTDEPVVVQKSNSVALSDDEPKKSPPPSKVLTEPSPIVPNPNSALAIRKRIGLKSSDRRSLTKKVSIQLPEKTIEKPEETIVEPAKEEETPVEPDIEVEPETKKVPEKTIVETAVKTTNEKGVEESTPVETEKNLETFEFEKPTSVPRARAQSIMSTQGVRSSNRRSKPNRLYNEDFAVDPSIQKVLMSTNRRNNDKSLDDDDDNIPSLSLLAPLSPSIVLPKPVPPPKPLLRFGCQRGYIPSKKELIEGTVLENGKEESVNTIVNCVLDQLMSDVCLDGVRKHSDISLDYRKTKAGKREEDIERRKKIEANRLVIAMRNPKPKPVILPSSSNYIVEQEELTKRKRIPKVASDDYMYGYSTTPQYKTGGYDEKKMEEGREFLAEEFNFEMEQNIVAEQEKYLENEENYMKRKKKQKPKISLDEYMIQRDVKNRPECGIKLFEDPKESLNNDNDDYFYCELLSDYPSTSSDRTDIDIDIEGRDEEEEIDIGDSNNLNDEQRIASHISMVLDCHGDSFAAADAIEKILSRPTNQDGTEYSLINVLERAASEHHERNMRILIIVIEFINAQYLLETTPSATHYNMESSLYNSTNLNAQKLKNAYAMFDNPQQDAIAWVHTFLVEHLPVDFLASYLVLLKHAKSMTASYIGKIVKQSLKEGHEWMQINSIIASHVSVKTHDPEEEFLDQTVQKHSHSDVVFLLVSPMMSIGDFWIKPRSHELLFRWLKQIGHPDSEIIKSTSDQEDTSSVAEFMCEAIVETVVEKVRQKYRENETCRIVVVGYGWTTYAVHHIAHLVNGISAIISLGFPVVCEYGRRGIADDDILLTYCPTLFVVGAEGEYYDNVAMKDMRTSMINHTGLVVVGHANDQLLVPTSVLVRLGVTQKVVFRLIFEKIVSFLQLDETKWERTKLFPVKLNNVIQIDPSILKGGEKAPTTPQSTNTPLLAQLSTSQLPGSSPAASPLGGIRRNTVAVCAPNTMFDDYPRQMAQPISLKKKKPDHPQGYVSSLASSEARQKFQDSLLKKVQVPESLPHRIPIDIPSYSSQLKSIERGDLRERSLTLPTNTTLPSPSTHFHRPSLIPQSRFAIGPSSSSSTVSRVSSSTVPQSQKKESSGLIDPASISLI